MGSVGACRPLGAVLLTELTFEGEADEDCAIRSFL